MLGRLILVVVQLGACWFGAPLVLGYLPRGLGGDVTTLLHAGLFGVIAWVVGLVGSQALKDVALPSSKTLAWFIPLKFAPMFMPLGLAILGYAIKK
jgi:hypothetical protein